MRSIVGKRSGGCSERHFLRLRTRFDDEGIEGLRDRRIGRVSGRRVADSEVERITALYRDRYRGFTVRYFHEFAVARHHLSQGYTWTKACPERQSKGGAAGGGACGGVKARWAAEPAPAQAGGSGVQGVRCAA